MTHTFTTTYVTCRECGHRLTEIMLETGLPPRPLQTADGYHCDPVDLVLNNGIARAGPNYGCGVKYDLSGNLQ